MASYFSTTWTFLLLKLDFLSTLHADRSVTNGICAIVNHYSSEYILESLPSCCNITCSPGIKRTSCVHLSSRVESEDLRIMTRSTSPVTISIPSGSIVLSPTTAPMWLPSWRVIGSWSKYALGILEIAVRFKVRILNASRSW